MVRRVGENVNRWCHVERLCYGGNLSSHVGREDCSRLQGCIREGAGGLFRVFYRREGKRFLLMVHCLSRRRELIYGTKAVLEPFFPTACHQRVIPGQINTKFG